MRKRVALLVLGMVALATAAIALFLRSPELRDMVVDEPIPQGVTRQEPAKPDGATEETPSPAVREGATPTEPQCEVPPPILDPVEDFARYIAEQHRDWRRHGGEFLPARELASLYGLDVYALPAGQRPPSPGVTPLALKLGYYVVAPRFVESLAEQGRRLRPLQERDLGEGASGANGTAQGNATDDPWTRDLLQRTAAKARGLAACNESQDSEETDCRFARAFMQGLAGSEADSGRLRTEAAEVLVDLAGRLESRAGAQGDAAPGQAAQ